jgi:hypothetical protein
LSLIGRSEVVVRGTKGSKGKSLSADDVDELIDMLEVSDDEKVRRFWQTMKE